MVDQPFDWRFGRIRPRRVVRSESTGSSRQCGEGGQHHVANQVAAIAAPIVTGYLIGSRNDYSRAFIAAAGAIVVGIAGYAFLLCKIERIPDPVELVHERGAA